MQLPIIYIPTGAWNMRAGISAEQVLDAARKAEAAGIDGLFAGDHVTFYGYGNDGLIALSAVAAVRNLDKGVYPTLSAAAEMT